MVLLASAVREGRTRQVKLLLKAGVNVNLSDKDGQTAIIHCCFIEDPKVRLNILRLLAANGSDASKRDKYGRGVVSWACVYARTDVLSYLLNDTAIELDFSTVDNDGNSTLLLAVMSGSLEMVQMVLMVVLKTSSTDQIHRCNNAGMCPLLAAFSRGDKKCAQLLIKEGCSPVSSVIKYLQEQNEVNPEKPHPFYDFMARSRDPERPESPSDNPKVPSERDILQFLFAKDDMSARANKTRTSLSLKTKLNTMIDFSSTKSTIGLNTRHSHDLPDIADAITTSESLHANLRISVSKYYSSQESVLQLYDLYQEQLTPSYREGLPVRRYRTPTPPPPPRKDSRSRKMSVQGNLSPKRGSISSISGSNPLMQESGFDRQMRLRYARSSRASSMQVAKLPPIPVHLKKLKKTKSSTSLKEQTNSSSV